MQKVSSFFDTRRISGIVAATVLSLLLVAGFTYGVTTISTNINTAGTLTVSGTSAFTGNITSAGNINATGTLQVTDAFTAYGAVTLGDAVTDNITITGNATSSNSLFVTGTANFKGLASTSQLVVGGQGTNGTISGMIIGTCDLTAQTFTASTTKTVYCSNATGVRAGDKVFVSATSSLAVGAVNELWLVALTGAASSTVSGRIDVDIMNIVGKTSPTIAGTLNFWAVR
ncbi:MAG: hypothetical protein A2931_00940 [Candidatus Niyogibacteria bacterium RIFCSPLOWO2_01_FULL_45_48]|uniref:Uncharacterized protein n=2 Tax=Candidatus Niyogiibacteriota TaxID=1817912 RepID=A0A1G2F037_9BACT|nr:MAG: hypothetical protein A2931_00940 [Candidatus Niyogibacteria bacterium RIFCSPLOWO2_01_FULL_45_48]OGZ30848.1 MAG: hypothetical protein A2835_01015 [Candidatus Niyogibacteria bacterium RIFCSPHIGHO2_01_FULL_45_28]OGZ31454.1 MAG: hypothetical protein A3J00_02425 [Candidatus Niyogibacteria bacterium RIFCSPLOWO2_02_FULL_45_13]